MPRETDKANMDLKPFLRWAGGKQTRIKHIAKFLPIFNREEYTYIEPFMGAASLFFHVKPRNAILSDLNEHLIHVFRTIRDKPLTLSKYLGTHNMLSSEKYYYFVRQKFNRAIDKFTVSQAARFIYLNRACFNGIFRVNLFGQFNVPYGNKENLFLPTRNELFRFSSFLKSTKLHCLSYEKIINFAKSGDFVYLDPPYPPINGTSYFTHYTKDRFDNKDQENVRDFADELNRLGCNVLVSNADMKVVRDLYSNWNLFKTEVTRYISCKSRKHSVGELLITNYDLNENI